MKTAIDILREKLEKISNSYFEFVDGIIFDCEHYKSKNPDIAVQLSRYIDEHPDINLSEILEYEGILIGMPYCGDDGIWRRWDTIITEAQAQEIAQNEYYEE